MESLLLRMYLMNLMIIGTVLFRDHKDNVLHEMLGTVFDIM